MRLLSRSSRYVCLLNLGLDVSCTADQVMKVYARDLMMSLCISFERYSVCVFFREVHGTCAPTTSWLDVASTANQIVKVYDGLGI